MLCLCSCFVCPPGVQRLLHGSGGIARAHDSRVGTGLAVLAFVRAGRSTRQHHGQPRRTIVEHRPLGGPVGEPTAGTAYAPGESSHCRCDYRDRLRTAFSAAQSRARPGQAGRSRGGGTRSRSCPPPGDQTHPGLEPAPPRCEGTAGGDETAATAAVGRVTPLSLDRDGHVPSGASAWSKSGSPKGHVRPRPQPLDILPPCPLAAPKNGHVLFGGPGQGQPYPLFVPRHGHVASGGPGRGRSCNPTDMCPSSCPRVDMSPPERQGGAGPVARTDMSAPARSHWTYGRHARWLRRRMDMSLRRARAGPAVPALCAQAWTCRFRRAMAGQVRQPNGHVPLFMPNGGHVPSSTPGRSSSSSPNGQVRPCPQPLDMWPLCPLFMPKDGHVPSGGQSGAAMPALRAQAWTCPLRSTGVEQVR